MAKEKTPKTNAMRILDRLKISYEVLSYQCDAYIWAVKRTLMDNGWIFLFHAKGSTAAANIACDGIDVLHMDHLN